MEKMLIPLIETVLDPVSFIPTTRDGQLRSDLIQLVGKKADRCQILREKPAQGTPFQRGETAPVTASLLDELSQNRTGRWNFYSAQFFLGDKLLFAAGRFGAELMLFHLSEDQAQKLAALMAEYPEVTDTRIFPMPEEVMNRWARQIS